MSPRLPLALALALATCTFSCGRQHLLSDGPYQFHLDRVIRDDCSLATRPAVFSTGTLSTFGHVVSIEYGGVVGAPTPFFLGAVQLVGNYSSTDLTRIEHMRLDGSNANVNTLINNTECLLDLAVLHIDATTVDSSRFTGTFAIDLQSARHNECVCQFTFNYTATAIPTHG